jgi:hypothetical protein
LFLAKDTTGDNLKQVRFDENKVIRTIHGDAAGFNMKKIHLKDKDNNEIAKIEAFNDNPGQEMHLNEGEAIIGVYGHKDTINFFYNLGFIVWTPHYD